MQLLIVNSEKRKTMPRLIKTITEVNALQQINGLNKKELDVTVELHFISKGDISQYLSEEGIVNIELLKKKFLKLLAEAEDIEI